MAYSIPTAKLAILTALGARTALNGIPKLYAPPTEADDITWGAIWLGPEVKATSDWAQLGGQRRRVEFRIPYVITAVTKSDNPQSTDAQVWTYFEEFEAAIRSNPTLGGSVQQFDVVTTDNRVVPTGPDMWEASIAGEIVCTSRSY